MAEELPAVLLSAPKEALDEDEEEGDEPADTGDLGGGGMTGVERMESSATRSYPLCPDASGTLVRITLLTAIERMLLLTLPANDRLSNHLGTLRRAAPFLLLGIALLAGGLNDLRLLSHGFVELQ